MTEWHAEIVALTEVLARHDIFGPEGIPADGHVAWLQCPCGYSLNFEMPEDDMALVNAKAMEHLAQVAVAHHMEALAPAYSTGLAE